MFEAGRFVDGLKAAGVEFFSSVPDSPLKSFCAYVTDTCVVKDVTPPLLFRQWGQTLCPHTRTGEIESPCRGKAKALEGRIDGVGSEVEMFVGCLKEEC